MHRTSLPFALALIARASAQTTFIDGDFPNPSWSSFKVIDTTPAQAAQHTGASVPIGGNPLIFRETQVISLASGQVVVAHINAPANYWPLLQGELQTLEGAFDLRDTSAVHAADARYRLLLRQEGTYYVGGPEHVAPISGWENREIARVRASGFTRIAGAGPDHPDFGPQGEFFELGYAVFVDASGTTLSVSGIDNWKVKIGYCYADCDESGALDFFDFLCFQNAFALQDFYADCDGSGALDFFDFLCFQNQFAAGCL